MGLIARKRADSPQSYGHIGEFHPDWAPRFPWKCPLYRPLSLTLNNLKRPGYVYFNAQTQQWEPVEYYNYNFSLIAPPRCVVTTNLTQLLYKAPSLGGYDLIIHYEPTVTISGFGTLSSVWILRYDSPFIIYNIAFVRGNKYIPPRMGWTIVNGEYTGPIVVDHSPYDIS